MYDLIIAGGPAGLGWNLRHAGGAECVAEKGMPGGQIALTKDVENYPGFEDWAGLSCAKSF